MIRLPRLLIVMLPVMGCATMQYGYLPETRGLVETLTPDVSTKEDVLQELGPPRGYGKASLHGIEGHRTIWYYEAAAVKGTTVSVGMILVFFEGDVYDGYLWFSSIERLQPAGSES